MRLKHRIYNVTDQDRNKVNLEDEKDVRLVKNDEITEILLTDIFKRAYFDDGDIEGFSVLFKSSNTPGEPIEDGNLQLGDLKLHLYIPKKENVEEGSDVLSDKHIFFTELRVPRTLAPSVAVGSNYIIGICKMLGILDKADEIFSGELDATELDAIHKAKEEELALKAAEEVKPENTETRTEETTGENPEGSSENSETTESTEAQNPSEVTEIPIAEGSETEESQSENVDPAPISSEATEGTKVSEVPQTENANENVSDQLTTEVPPVTAEVPPVVSEVPVEQPKQEESIQEETKVEEPALPQYEFEKLTLEEKEDEPESRNWWNKISKGLKKRFFEEREIDLRLFDMKYEEFPLKRQWLRFSANMMTYQQYQDAISWFGKRGFEEYVTDGYHFFHGEPLEEEDVYPFVLANRGKGIWEVLDGGIASDTEESVEYEFTDEGVKYIVTLDKNSNEVSVAEKVA